MTDLPDQPRHSTKRRYSLDQLTADFQELSIRVIKLQREVMLLQGRIEEQSQQIHSLLLDASPSSGTDSKRSQQYETKYRTTGANAD